MLTWLEPDDPFPPVQRALKNPNGLLAAGADLSVARLLEAYGRGVFPWFSAGQPPLWWSPDPRMVLYCAELKVSRSLAKSLRNKGFELRVDSAFGEVLEGCAFRPQGTWLGADMKKAYLRLHREGYAHSFETWRKGELVGGLYGVALGRMFYGESMFTHASDASKIALAHLARQLERWGCGMIDCQMTTAHLARFGAREIPRPEFMRKLAELVNYPPTGRSWSLDDDLFE